MEPRKYKHFEYEPIATPSPQPPKNRQAGYATTRRKKNEGTGGDDWDKSDVEDSDDDMKRQGTSAIVDHSQWQSKMFKVQRTAQTASWQHSDYYRYHIFKTTKWIIVPIFLLFSVATIVISIFYFLHDITKYIAFAIILGINIIGGLLGAIFVYKYGTVQSVIDFMKLQNEWYETEMDVLTENRKNIATEARNVHFEVNKLKSISKDLDEQLENFENLRIELEGICKQNESMQDKLNEITTICNDLELAIQKNERAHLLTIYYDLCTRSSRDHLTRRDYKHLLGRLNKKTRKEIEMQGGFDGIDKDNNGFIDVNEFQDLINTVLEITQEQEGKLLKRLTQLNYTGKKPDGD